MVQHLDWPPWYRVFAITRRAALRRIDERGYARDKKLTVVLDAFVTRRKA